ncbi:MAG: hypothetical protein Q8K79_09950 [Solirubrobacteraceae bacterium]|nr:hypothetical protein [Solirubrobacteraceae bacterium]
MPHDPPPTADSTRTSLERWLIALAALAAWSIVPPYLGPLIGLELDVASTVEVVDHVLPGLCAVAAAYIALVEVRRGQTDSFRALAALGVCALAGLFQTVTHATLVLDAGGPLQPVGSVVLHATPGPLLLGLSLWLLVRPQSGDAVA